MKWLYEVFEKKFDILTNWLNSLLLNTNSSVFLYASIVLFLIWSVFARGIAHSLKLRISYSILFFIFLFANGFYIVSNYFTGKGVDQSVIYHLKYGLKGSGYTEYHPLIIGVLIFIIFSIILSIFFYKYISSFNNIRQFLIRFLLSILIVFAILTNPLIKDIYKLIHFSQSSIVNKGIEFQIDNIPKDFEFVNNNYIFDGYHHPKLSKITIPKNIVVIYLEGVEETYFNQKTFPNLMPGLSEIKKNAIFFEGIKEVEGTNWTIAGMVASQCGVPLSSYAGNRMYGIDFFLKGANCLGDILKQKKFYLEYMGGASLEFAGKGKFYKTHNFNQVNGREELHDKIENGYKTGWGLFDDALFSLAINRFKKLYEKNSPFGLFLLTLDTHSPIGHPSRECDQLVYKDGSNPMLNAVHCTDFLVTKLINQIQDFDINNNTLIVVLSDHLAMRNTATKLLNLNERYNLFIALHPRQQIKGNIKRSATQFDISPTLLSLMGFNVPKLGFGRDLLRSQKTLAEKYHEIDNFINSHSNFYASLWQYPKLDNGLTINMKDKILLLGNNRRIKYPALLEINKNGEVDKIKLSAKITLYGPAYDLTKDILKLSLGSGIIWIDQCKKIASLNGDYSFFNNNYCIGIGVLGGNWKIEQIKEESRHYSFSILTQNLFVNNIEKNEFEKQLSYVNNMVQIGDFRIRKINFSNNDNLKGEILIKSTGGYKNGNSFVQVTNIKPNVRETVKRGITLFGVSQDSVAIKLSYIDSCAVGHIEYDLVGLNGGIVNVIKKLKNNFGAFIVIVHDSAFCRNKDLFYQAFNGLPLTKWRSIDFRQPYVAIINSNGHFYEEVGEVEKNIVLYITNFATKYNTKKKNDSKNKKIQRVAHAGGGYNKETYTNSIEALNYNADKYYLFEIDFSFTKDNKLVCLHDWKDGFTRSYGYKINEPLSLSDFEQINDKNLKYTKCTLENLITWLTKNKNAKIITDIKTSNIKGLEFIANKYTKYLNRFIPQIYHQWEYYQAKLFGYNEIIWTLYRTSKSNDLIIRDVNKMELYAVTMPKNRAKTGLGLRLKEKNVNTYVHTINLIDEVEKYKKLGIDEIYTDWLHPSDKLKFEISY